MAKKFIPNGDSDFWRMSDTFARNIAQEPARYGVSDDDAKHLETAVAAYAEAYQHVANRFNRSPANTAAKEEARRAAEAIIRKLAAGMRADRSLDAATRVSIGLQDRAKPTGPTKVPNEVPHLYFKRALHEGGMVPEHELEFCSLDHKPRPAGAVRLELFVELIPPDADVHQHYSQPRGVRPIYVRSFTKSPIRLVPPMADVPMRVMYFARWADSEGETGPMCNPQAGWVEGGSHHLMAAMTYGHKKVMRVDVAPETTEHEATVFVALLSGAAAKRFNGPEAMKQIEGTVEVEAA